MIKSNVDFCTLDTAQYKVHQISKKGYSKQRAPIDHFYFFFAVQEINVCASAPCLNGGTCINTGADFRCMCTRAFYGNQCQLGESVSTICD